jgi:hypothetical protein
MFVWFGSLILTQVMFNAALFGAPFATNTFPSTLLEFTEYVAVFIGLLLMPSFLSSILIRKSTAEFG